MSAGVPAATLALLRGGAVQRGGAPKGAGSPSVVALVDRAQGGPGVRRGLVELRGQCFALEAG